MTACKRYPARRQFLRWSVGAALAAGPLLAGTASSDAPLKEGFASGDGVELFFVQTGDGPMILFLHGFPEDWRLYQPYLHEFGRDHLAVAANLRGVLPSTQPADVGAYAMPHLLGDLHALLDHFGRESCVIVANDWGAYIAWVFASAYPDRVDRLVIMNGAHPALLLRDYRSDPAQIAASQYESDASLGPLPYAAYIAADPVKVPPSPEAAAAMPKPDLAKVFFTGAARPPATRSLIVPVPTLVIWGMVDPYQLPGLLNGLEDYATNLTVREIAEAGHWPMRTHAGEVTRAIREFLAE